MPIMPSVLPPFLLADAVRATMEMELMIALTVTAVGVGLAAASLAFAFRKSKGTTLRAPLVWAMVSLVSLIAAEGLQLRYRASDGVRTKWDFIVATSTFCPIIALLGAKRPQNRAWQWIVLTLWGVVALPAIESLIIHPQESFEMHPVWQIFVGLLIVVGCVNYLPTCYAVPSLIVAAGQCVLFGASLFGPDSWLLSFRLKLFTLPPLLAADGKTQGLRMWLLLAGILPLTTAVCAASVVGRKPCRLPTSPLADWNRVWRDFRNDFGLLWAARIVERFNAQAHGSGVNVRLTWSGFEQVVFKSGDGRAQPTAVVLTEQSSPSSVSLGPLENIFRNLLRRFVSDEWIDARIRSSSQP
jgi:hypothetical protein